jgi:hypothetical protein
VSIDVSHLSNMLLAQDGVEHTTAPHTKSMPPQHYVNARGESSTSAAGRRGPYCTGHGSKKVDGDSLPVVTLEVEVCTRKPHAPGCLCTCVPPHCSAHIFLVNRLRLASKLLTKGQRPGWSHMRTTTAPAPTLGVIKSAPQQAEP